MDKPHNAHGNKTTETIRSGMLSDLLEVSMCYTNINIFYETMPGKPVQCISVARAAEQQRDRVFEVPEVVSREAPYPTVQLSGSCDLPSPYISPPLGWNPWVFCCFLISSCWKVSVLFKEGLKRQLLVGLSFKVIIPCFLQVLWRNICFQPEMWALCLLLLCKGHQLWQ